MSPTIAAVYGKARAFVEGLARLPHSSRAAVPNGHFARDYNTLRRLAQEVAPDLDERLLGKYVGVHETPDGELSNASYAEIEVYARQIAEQLGLVLNSSAPGSTRAVPSATTAVAPAKAYDIAVIREQYSQAYAPWSEQDDEYLRCRFLEGAPIEDLVSEFARKPSAILSRLRKLGLEERCRPLHPDARDARAEQTAAGDQPQSHPAQPIPEWEGHPPQSGKPWTPEEDQALLREFESGLALEEIARLRGRGVFAVEVRLAKLGRDSNRENQPELGGVRDGSTRAATEH